MRIRGMGAALVAAAVALAACTGDDPASEDPTTASDTPAAITTTPATSPTPSPSPSPSGTELTEDTEFGSGTAVVDGTEVRVKGDCDIARAYGAEPVEALDDPAVDILLGVDNLTAPDDGPDGPYAFDVVVVEAPDGSRVVRSVGAPDGQDILYEGPVTEVELRDRTSLDHVDAAILHLEATLTQDWDPDVASTRELVLDVACTITRPV